MKNHAWLFLLIIFIFSVFYIDVWRNANTVSRLLPVKTIVEDGTWHIDKYHEQTIDKAFVNGHYYSEKAPLPALFTIPAYALLHAAGLTGHDNVLYITGSIIIAVIPFVIIVMLIFNSLLRKGVQLYESMLITMLLSFSTFIFIYAGTPFSHILSALWLLISYIYIKEKENFLLAGLFAGLAFITEYPTGIAIAIWPLVLILRNGKMSNAMLFYTGVAPTMILLLIYNYSITGNPFDMLYNHLALDLYVNSDHTLLGFALPSLRAMYELLFGFYRGWLFHAPVVVLFLAMIIKQTVKTPVQMVSGFLLPLIIVTFIVFSSHQVWYGGWCFGPRHFVPVTVLMLYHFAGYMHGKKHIVIPFYILSFAGLVYTWMAKSTLLYSINAEYRNPLMQLILPALEHGQYNPNNILSLLFDIQPRLANLAWAGAMIVFTLFLFVNKRNKQPL